MKKLILVVFCIFALISMCCKAEDSGNDNIDLNLHPNYHASLLDQEYTDGDDYAKIVPIDIFGTTRFLIAKRDTEPYMGEDTIHMYDSPSYEYTKDYTEYYHGRDKSGVSSRMLFLDDFQSPMTSIREPKPAYSIFISPNIDFKMQLWKPAVEYHFVNNPNRSVEFVIWDRSIGDLGVVASGGPVINYKIKF